MESAVELLHKFHSGVVIGQSRSRFETAMRQTTFANQSGFEKYARKSRREEFLSTMEVVVP
jgi:hypothetical protein